jgi:hypothetical protein
MKFKISDRSLRHAGLREDRILTYVRDRPVVTDSALGAAALAVSALVNHGLAKKAEQSNPPEGRFLDIDGVMLHYVERGRVSRSSFCTATAA